MAGAGAGTWSGAAAGAGAGAGAEAEAEAEAGAVGRTIMGQARLPNRRKLGTLTRCPELNFHLFSLPILKFL